MKTDMLLLRYYFWQPQMSGDWRPMPETRKEKAAVKPKPKANPSVPREIPAVRPPQFRKIKPLKPKE